MATTPTELHLGPVPAAGLASLGWDLNHAEVRDTVPALARGNNLVLVQPPAPAYAAPALAGLLSGDTAETGTTLVVSPGPFLGEWGHVLAPLTGDRGAGVLMVHGVASGATQLRLRAAETTLLVVSPEQLGGLFAASALEAGRIRALLLAWPEVWEAPDEVLTGLLPEVSREAQRAILTSDPDWTADLVQRHAWRAMTLGARPEKPAGPVRTLAVAWARRVAVLPELLAALDAGSAAVWTADTGRHAEIRRALLGAGIPTEVTRDIPGPANHIVAFDPPPSARLHQLIGLGLVTLLVPPGTERWVRAVAGPREPFLLPGDPAVRAGETAKRRGQIVRTLEQGPLEEGLLALGPLFERYEPTAVAAALYQLGRAGDQAPAPVGPPAAPPARVWVNAGRRDEVGPNDLVGLLVNEVGVGRSQIGRIEVRDTFSLIEVPAEDGPGIAGALTGRTLRRRRLVARVDTGPPPQRGRQPR